MCIGIPMQVLQGHAGTALCHDAAGTPLTVRTSLIGAVQPGDWLLVFQADAVERLDAQRAQEILATLALVQSAMAGGAASADAARADAAFALPSRLSKEALQQLTS